LILGEGEALALHSSQVLSPVPSAQDRVDSDSLRLQELERRAIFEALRRTKSHQAKAADLLGITDRTLREKLRRYRQDGRFQPTGERTWITEPA
jgi:DNA-binding NtrC family response regulator